MFLGKRDFFLDDERHMMKGGALHYSVRKRLKIVEG